MQPPIQRAAHRLVSVLLSSVFHVTVLACTLFFAVLARQHRVIEPVAPRIVAQVAISGGSHHVSIPLPVRDAAAHTRNPAPIEDSAKRTNIPIQAPPLKTSGGGAPAKPHRGDGTGKAVHGNGSDAQDIRPAFPIFSPHPPVHDRALLPRSEQHVVVDVDVDVLGTVVKANLVKGLGNKLDQICLEMVKTWRFHPATIDGKPVATVAEVIFPFNQDYPVSDS
jgi:TonB family protein